MDVRIAKMMLQLRDAPPTWSELDHHAPHASLGTKPEPSSSQPSNAVQPHLRLGSLRTFWAKVAAMKTMPVVRSAVRTVSMMLWARLKMDRKRGSASRFWGSLERMKKLAVRQGPKEHETARKAKAAKPIYDQLRTKSLDTNTRKEKIADLNDGVRQSEMREMAKHILDTDETEKDPSKQ
ncbi:MAG: hypothetical protein AAGA72_13600 [Pseudomonadota bacterium]